MCPNVDSCLKSEFHIPQVADLNSCKGWALPPEVFDNDRKEAVLQAYVDTLSNLKHKKLMLVGHNLFLDLIYFYKCFFGPLPNDVRDFVPIMRAMFPIIFDTKLLADDLNNYSPTCSSSLEDIVQELVSSDARMPIAGNYNAI